MQFIGRKDELNKLESLYNTNGFQMVVLYGRRRVGKTTLINEFCRDKKTIFCVGIESSEKENLKACSAAVWENTGVTEEMPPFADFGSLFRYVAGIGSRERLVFVIDEYPYLAAAVPAVSSILQSCIDHEMNQTKLFLILCGSSMSFMENQVLGYKSPLYGRRTAQFKVRPFSFWETMECIPAYKLEEQAVLYGATGGIPEYLSHIDASKTMQDNLVALFFDISGRLFEEPSNLLKQELRDPKNYNAILTAIAGGHSKLNEISTAVGIPTGGCSNLLVSLMELGIVEKETPVGVASVKRTLYKIKDQMFRFWYRFVGRYLNMITAGYGGQIYQKNVMPHISDFMGQVFEQICREWIVCEQAYSDSPIYFTQIGRWWGGNPSTKSQEEIDILAIDGKSAVIGECKWTSRPVDSDILMELLRKAELFSYSEKRLYLFSKSGYTKKCISHAAEMQNVRLISFEDMVHGRI